MDFGLIGGSLSHSFSKEYFEKKFRALGLANFNYELYELAAIHELKPMLARHPLLKGFNVTIPFKETIVPMLDVLQPEAKQTGAVNCVKVLDGKLIGYNTDVYGFSQSLKPFLDPNHERALILGTGGSSKAVAWVLKKMGVEYYFVTHSPQKKKGNVFLYSDINENVMKAFKMVVNCTPVGMYPHVNEAPLLPYTFFTPLHLAYDLVYNPAETLFLKQAREQGAIVVNGLSMLQLQAEKSWQIWNETGDSEIE